jgi:hypothetical protein
LKRAGDGTGIAEVVVQEVAQAAERLELGHVGVQIHAVNTPDLKRHVVTDNTGDVGRHSDLLGGRSPMKVLQLEYAGRFAGPNIVFYQAAAQRPPSEGSPE